MRKAILMMLLAVMGSGASAENTAPSYFQPWNEVQAYAPTLDWKTGAIPKGAWNGLPKWMSERDADGELNWSRPVAFLSVDLDGDGNDELIVRSGEWFSGGPEFVILKKSSNRWRTIGGFQGGFTISKRLKKGYVFQLIPLKIL